MTGSHSNKYRCPNVFVTVRLYEAAWRGIFEPVARKTCWNQKWLTTVKGQLIAVISTERRNINSILIPLYSIRDDSSHSNKYRCQNVFVTVTLFVAAARVPFEPVVKKTY